MSETEDPRQAQLDQLRARRAQLADAAAARTEPTIDEQIAAEEKALADDEALDKAQQQYGARSVRLVPTDAGAIIVRRPHIAAFRKFQDIGELKTDALEELVKSSLVYPSKPEFDKIMREYPAKLTDCGNAVVELAGHGASKNSKK